MTHDYKAALECLDVAQKYDDFKLLYAHKDTIRHALTIAAEYERVKRERDEFATAIIKIHEDQEGDYDFLKFISHPQYILAKKVSAKNEISK